MKVKPIIPIILLLLSLIATIISTLVSADFIKTINPDLLVYTSIAVFIGITSFTALYAFLNSHKKIHRLTALSAYLIAVSMSITTIYQQIESPNTHLENKERSDKVKQINTQIDSLQNLNTLASNDINRLSKGLTSSKYKTRDKANIRTYKQEINTRNAAITAQQSLLPDPKSPVITASKINYLHLFYASIWDCFALFMQLFARFLRQNKRDQHSQALTHYTQIISDLKQLNADASVTSTNLLRRNTEANTLNSTLKQHQDNITAAQQNFDNKTQQVEQSNQQLNALLNQSKGAKTALIEGNQEAKKQQKELKELQGLLNTTSQRCIDTTDQSRESLQQDQRTLQVYQGKLNDTKEETVALNQSSYQHLSDLRDATHYLNEMLLKADKKKNAFATEFSQRFNEWKQSFNGFNESMKQSDNKVNELNQRFNELINGFNERFNETDYSMNSMEKRIKEFNESINGKFIEFNESMKQSNNQVTELNQGVNKTFNGFNERFNETDYSMDSMEKRLKGFNEINELINGKFNEFNESMQQSDNQVIQLNQRVNESFNGFNQRFNEINERFNESSEGAFIELNGFNESMNSPDNQFNELNQGVNESSNGFNERFNEINENSMNHPIEDNDIKAAIDLLRKRKIARSVQGRYTNQSITDSSDLPLSKVKEFKETAEALGLLISAKSSSGTIYVDAIEHSQCLMFDQSSEA